MFLLLYLLGYTAVAVMLVTGTLNRHGFVSVADIIKTWLMCIVWPILFIAYIDDCDDYKWARNFRENMGFGIGSTWGILWERLANYKILRKR